MTLGPFKEVLGFGLYGDSDRGNDGPLERVNAGRMGRIGADVRISELDGVSLFNDLLDSESSVGRNVDVPGPVDGAVGLKEPEGGVSKEGFVFWVCLLVVEGE